MIAMFLYNITDTYFVSMLGEETFAGFGLMAPLVLFTIILFNATSSSVSIHIGKAFGANRITRIRKKILVGSSLLFFISFILFILFFFFSNELANNYHSTPTVTNYFLEYFNWWIWTLVVNSLIVLYSFSLNSMKKTKLSTTIHMVGLLINVVLDYALIFGVGEFIPALGLAGAAIATLISNVIHLMILIYFLNKMNLLTFRIKLSHYRIFFKKIRTLALPISLQGMIIPFGIYLFAIFVSSYSPQEIAAWSLYMKFEGVIFIVAASANATLGILASIYFGKKNFTNIPLLFTLSNRIIFSWLAFLIVSMIFFSKGLGSAFLTNPETITIFSTTIILGFISYILDSAGGNINKIFTVLHNPYIGLSIASFRIVVSVIVMPYVFSIWFGYWGLFYGFMFGTLLSFVFSYSLFKKYSPEIKNIKFNSLYW